MAKPITVFRGASGINNKIDPVRLRFDPKSGITELAAAVNVDIDQTGRVSRRNGYTLQKAGSYHSLYSCGPYALAVTGTNLGILDADMTFTAIATVQPGVKMSCVTVGNRTYWMNGYQKGYVENRANNAWIAADYVGPTTTKTFSDPPIGHLLDLFNGRLYVAQEAAGYHVLWYSQPFAYHWFDLARNFIPFESRIRMLRAVRGGIFVGTEDKTYFLSGATPQEFTQVVVAGHSVVEGTDALIPLSRTPYGEAVQGMGAIWCGEEGICLGGPNGEFFNLTEKKLTLPSANKGAGFVNGDKYYCLLEE